MLQNGKWKKVALVGFSAFLLGACGTETEDPELMDPEEHQQEQQDTSLTDQDGITEDVEDEE